MFKINTPQHRGGFTKGGAKKPVFAPNVNVKKEKIKKEEKEGTNN